ncbi:MAG: Lacal_2735 family protein [Planctomycetota bacterium]|nr:MAG: Lacal_2735 family protein [Planctomycetota bacterium]REJ87701.1 MAG: Lacal_2735 family protein [Planctomycetota bacterium]REK28163.1 MAG: Lacal_2735 family protein [Planctomycetota bacterium]REK34410.1 MAG: Lacal_2735 family protein [Planctomycetota bacterium]
MFGWLKQDPVKKLELEYARMLKHARDVQRNGDIVRYSEIMAEADAVLRQIDESTDDSQAGGS